MKLFRYAAGLKLAQYGGSILNIFGAFFDIYQVNIAASKLKTETDPDIQQDLKVSIGLSSLGAGSSVIIGLGLLALSGKMALAAGTIGIALGILTAVVGRIYYSAREIEKIESYTKLTLLQKLRTGLFHFLGAEIDVEVTNKVTKQQQQKRLKKIFITS